MPTLYRLFNVKRNIWLKGYQNGDHIELSEQWLQEISIEFQSHAQFMIFFPRSKIPANIFKVLNKQSRQASQSS